MTLTAIAREDANIAADEARRLRRGLFADRGCLRGIGSPQSAFADKHCRRVIAQAQAGSMLDGERTIGADFIRLDLQVTAQGIGNRIGTGKSAYRRAAYPHDGSADGLPIEHLVEIDHTTYVCEPQIFWAACKAGRSARRRCGAKRSSIDRRRVSSSSVIAFSGQRLVLQYSIPAQDRPMSRITSSTIIVIVPELKGVCKPRFRRNDNAR